MTKKDFILALCEAIGKPVRWYMTGGGYTVLFLKGGWAVDVYCDRCKSTETCSLKLKFHLNTIGIPELKKAKHFIKNPTWSFEADIYESHPDQGARQTVLRIRTHFYWPWEWPGELSCDKHPEI